ncbi:MAG: hypothetical protein JWN46_302, partial [Acidimicrobiales bacterium]|nr:hypothetical protein [Acidimicrobiales bacterium]
AEGVEAPDELVLLRRLGCDLAQGFHLSRPLPGPSVEAWLIGNQEPVGEPAPTGSLHA